MLIFVLRFERMNQHIYMSLIAILFKGLRPVLEGFVATMHGGACETGSQIPRPLGRGILMYSSHKPEGIVTTNPGRSVLIPIMT